MRVFFLVIGLCSFLSILSFTNKKITIERGPYLQLSTANSIYIRWKTDIASISKVRYGETLAFTDSIILLDKVTEHLVQLNNLKPYTKYYYTVENEEGILQGDSNNFFYTKPDSEIPFTRIWAIGDFGMNSQAQAQVEQSYLNYSKNQYTNVWLWLGDNAYSSGTLEEYQKNVFDSYYKSLFKSTVVWGAPGNHDLYKANAEKQTGAYFDLLTIPTNGESGGVPSGTEAYYSFDYSNIHFISLDSYTQAHRSAGSKMIQWFESDLLKNKKKWTIVYFHHPPYSKGSHDSDVESEMIDMRKNIVPLVDKYGVDLVLTGHSHAYERSYLLKQHYDVEATLHDSMTMQTSKSGYFKKGGSNGGAMYVVCGVSGNTSTILSNGWPHNAMPVSTNEFHGSVVIDVTKDSLNCKFLTMDGTIKDEFFLAKNDKTELNKEINYLKVFPNPTKEEVNIHFLTDYIDNLDITLYTTQGQELFKSSTQNIKGFFTDTLSFKGLEQGSYIIRIKTQKSDITEKIILNN